MSDQDITQSAQEMGSALSAISRRWDGRSAILEMRDAGSRQWRQMEWMGFYFEFLCEQHLADIAEMPGPCYGKTTFDALKEIPWDFKMHATNTSSHHVVVNAREAIEGGLRDYGAVGVIVAMGDVTYNDEKRTFQKWHEELKGGASKYTRQREQRGAWSRFRKVAVELQQISFITIDQAFLESAGSFQTGFRNADGSPRREKVLIDLEQISDRNSVHSIDFSNG